MLFFNKIPIIETPLIRRFNWRYLRREWGRWCYRTNFSGEALECWFEWERDRKNAQAKHLENN